MAKGKNNRDTLVGETELTPEIMKKVDQEYISVRERSENVLSILEAHDLTRWDYLCFSVEFLGQFCLGFFSNDKVLMGAVKLVGKWLNNLHYFHAEELYGESGKRVNQ